MRTAVDCETTGVDLHHGCQPFFVSTCTEEGNHVYWEWDVDPLTRQVQAPREDTDEIAEYIREQKELVLHNSKFDVQALGTLSGFSKRLPWPWGKTQDTLIAGHVLYSGLPHDLTSMLVQFLDHDIQPYEDALEKACVEARRVVQQARQRIKRSAKKAKVGAPDDLFAEVEGGILTIEDEPLAAWKIAERGGEEMPSAKDRVWKFDSWLPRALIRWLWVNSEAGKTYTDSVQEGSSISVAQLAKLPGWMYHPPGLALANCIEEKGHPWWTVLAEYANTDTEGTVMLWQEVRKELERRNLWDIYQTRLQSMRLAHRLETQPIGVTLSKARLLEMRNKYEEESSRAGRVCLSVASSYGFDLTLPNGAVNNSLREFCFDVLKLPPIVNPKAKTDAPCLDAKNAIPYYLDTLPHNSKPLHFIKSLVAKRVRDTAIHFMDSYRSFWVPVGASRNNGEQLWYKLYPSLNPTGTATLRWSSSNPNSQNIGKKEEECEKCHGEGCEDCAGTGKDILSIRYIFGPSPGREWWSLDAKNIELRIPAYESGEKELIDLFERPNDPPYYGSEHLLNFSTVYPDIWEMELRVVGLEKVGPHIKKKYASTWYQRCKNGDFAVGYGAVDRDDGLGTADRTFGRPGSHAKLKSRFAKKEALNRRCIAFAEKHGYIETIPDKTVDPARGYPLMCKRTTYGRIKPTIPLNYRVQGTAMWWMLKAMIRCQEFLDSLNRGQPFAGKVWRGGYYMIIQVHDELVFDLPRGVGAEPWLSNYPVIKEIKRLMELGGEDIGIPTPTSCEYHAICWSEGRSV